MEKHPEVEFISTIVKNITGSDDFKIERTIDEKGVFLLLTTNGENIGRVIGKQGSTVNCIRGLLRTLGARNNARYNLKVEKA